MPIRSRVFGITRAEHKQPFPASASDGSRLTRERNDELSKYALLSLDIDPAAMLFDNDVMGH